MGRSDVEPRSPSADDVTADVPTTGAAGPYAHMAAESDTRTPAMHGVVGELGRRAGVRRPLPSSKPNSALGGAARLWRPLRRTMRSRRWRRAWSARVLGAMIVIMPQVPGPGPDF